MKAPRKPKGGPKKPQGKNLPAPMNRAFLEAPKVKARTRKPRTK